MIERIVGTLMLSGLLSGCAGPQGFGSMTMPTNPFPKMADVVDAMTSTGGERFEKTVPADLTIEQDGSVRRAVLAGFGPNWRMTILGMDTGRRVDGTLVSCGFYNAYRSDGGAKRSGIFRTETDPAEGTTVLREAAHSGSDRFVAFSNCQALGLL
ncbi:hypothetical protein U0C82_17000 [Fulvimarina sp. 2208YS6-2-32]|uniref:Uncharacterized protein n=1 Tax=Fulvimarina uroteuthidis TaxID=3098149 RepID=A0ABU5I636_9HYPH|nr:hypothetical protein [Fulvimarina sp. 2208YS6-2-32]MDY8110839.1 hypothetical protein [Fulvimarina sp. 2208YS6-2-32]